MTFDCNICFERLENRSDGRTSVNRIVRTPCGHLFHNECLTGWIETTQRTKGQAPNCPNCRAALKINGRPIAVQHVFPDKIPSGVTKSQTASSSSTTTRPFAKSYIPIVDMGPAPVLKCGKVNCLDLRPLHVNLIADYSKLDEYYKARGDEHVISAAKKQSLVDVKEDHLKNQRSQAETIRKLLRRPPCKCTTSNKPRPTATFKDPSGSSSDEEDSDDSETNDD